MSLFDISIKVMLNYSINTQPILFLFFNWNFILILCVYEAVLCISNKHVNRHYCQTYEIHETNYGKVLDKSIYENETLW